MTARILIDCLSKLLNSKEESVEDSLEAACVVLKAIGKDIEAKATSGQVRILINFGDQSFVILLKSTYQN
jgi:hypothetical protein